MIDMTGDSLADTVWASASLGTILMFAALGWGWVAVRQVRRGDCNDTIRAILILAFVFAVLGAGQYVSAVYRAGRRIGLDLTWLLDLWKVPQIASLAVAIVAGTFIVTRSRRVALIAIACGTAAAIAANEWIIDLVTGAARVLAQ